MRVNWARLAEDLEESPDSMGKDWFARRRKQIQERWENVLDPRVLRGSPTIEELCALRLMTELKPDMKPKELARIL